MKLTLTVFLSLFAFLTIVSCQDATPKESGGVDLLPPTSFMEAYQSEPEAVLIDCRTASEVARGKVEGAVNIDFRSPSFNDEAKKLDKSKPVYVYCQAGGRSAAAADALISLGFEEVHDMKGGFSAYSQE